MDNPPGPVAVEVPVFAPNGTGTVVTPNSFSIALPVTSLASVLFAATCTRSGIIVSI